MDLRTALFAYSAINPQPMVQMQRVEQQAVPGVLAMMRNIVAGLVLVGLMIIGVLAFAQRHDGCLHGHSIKDFRPCGSVSTSI
jgi:hypothetical protein